MMTELTPLELLAPARDLNCGLAAIRHGADAVYIGAPRFGARAAAGNSVSDIASLAIAAHRYHARVYVTLNTLLYDDELAAAESLVRQLHDAGADALIIQDMGLLELDLPPIPLFASTQAHNFDPERIRFLEKVGFRRVILARELTLKEIAAVRAATTLELEFFVAGSLCVSLSGQCYFSLFAKGRSANRGECAQMCRLPYSLTDEHGNVIAEQRHVLSLKDLDLSPHLDDLVAAGITSFKIEGRLKDPATVANLTAFYRAALDDLIARRGGMKRASSGRSTVSFSPDPERTFHRGSTTYFLKGRRRGIVELRTPKSVGTMLGKVRSVGKGDFTLDRPAELHNGDGLCFFNLQTGELRGTQVETVDEDRIHPNSLEGILPGMEIYRNHDREFLRAIESGNCTRTIDVEFTLTETPDGFALRALDEDGVTARAIAAHPKETAEKEDRALATIRAQLSKTGGTIFRVTGLTLDLDSSWFLPVSVLNRLRRDALHNLEEERLRNHAREVIPIVPNDVPYPSRSLDCYANVVNRMAEAFYRRHGVGEIAPGVDLQEGFRGTVLMHSRYCLKFEFGLCPGMDNGGSSPAPLYLTMGKERYRCEFDCGSCMMMITDSSPAAPTR